MAPQRSQPQRTRPHPLDATCGLAAGARRSIRLADGWPSSRSHGRHLLRNLFVSQELPPETGWGGIGTYVSIITEALAAAGVDVHVLSVVPGQQPSRKVVRGVVVHRHPLPAPRGSERLPPEAWRRIWLPFNVARLIKRLDLAPDVIECPEWCAEGLMLGLRRDVPLVVRMHSGARQLFGFNGQGHHLRGLDGRAAMNLEELSVRRADVVTATRSVLASVAPVLGLDADATREITYPVKPHTGPVPPNDDERPQVTFLGRFEPRKGPDIVLRAAPRVLAAVPNARFVFAGVNAGATFSADWLRAEAERLGITQSVEVVEEFGRPVVERELARAAVCVVPSRWESFGYTAAEAMSFGRPVVVSSIPPLLDVVGDGQAGRVAASEAPEDWATELIDLLSRPDDARALGVAGRQRIETVNAPAAIATATLEAHHLARERAKARRTRRS